MLKSGFFNSVAGDRKYSADDLSDFFIKLISDGVFPNPSDNLKVVANSGLTVTVKAGIGFIKAKYVNNTSDYDLTLDAADTDNPRIDRIVLRLSTTNRNITLNILKGTPAAEPEAPALTRTSTVYELCLASIAVAANATEIATADITDTRGNSSLCGYVYGLIQQIDTTDLFNQYNDIFETWFTNLQTTLTYNSSVKMLTWYTTLSSDTTTVPFTIENYNPALDIINVYVNGIRGIPNVNYTINENDQIVNFADTISSGSVVSLEVFRNAGEPNPLLYGDAPATNL